MGPHADGARAELHGDWSAGLVTAGLDPEWARDLALRALAEDLGGPAAGWQAVGAVLGHDVTTEATVAASAEAEAVLVARDDGVVAGLSLLPCVLGVAAQVIALPAPAADVGVADGDRVQRGQVIAVLTGRVRVLLLAERTLLNLMCRASGIATHARRWADALEGTGTVVLDTRKTTPGLRALEKYAVRVGGGANKRMGLADVAMVKDNHVAAAGSVGGAYRAVRTAFPGVAVQVEVEDLAGAIEALDAGARFLLCDNMAVADLGELVAAVRGRAADAGGGSGGTEIEATGGLTLDVARAYAATGVDFLSVGALTHSSPSLDIALDLRRRAG